MMSIREQQEAQMKVSIKDKVAMMKKKEEAERIRTLEDSGLFLYLWRFSP